MKLDFSEYHPLDHPLWACKGYPGGWRRHLDYSWDFIWKGRVRKATLCRAGLHRWMVWTRAVDNSKFVRCLDCPRKPSLATAKGVLLDHRDDPPLPRFGPDHD